MIPDPGELDSKFGIKAEAAAPGCASKRLRDHHVRRGGFHRRKVRLCRERASRSERVDELALTRKCPERVEGAHHRTSALISRVTSVSPGGIVKIS